MTRLHRTISDRSRTIRIRVRRTPAPAAARPGTPPAPDGFGDLSSLILYGQG